MSSDKLEVIKENYEIAKKLAQTLWLDGDYEGNANDFYYFECGFVAGMNMKIQNKTEIEIE
jgi:hypothetical protein